MSTDAKNALLQEYILESQEGLNTLNVALTNLEKNPGDKELLNSIYRSVHTMKGGARFLKFSAMEEITHVLENPLDLLREGKLSLTPEMTDLLLKGIDLIQTHIKNIESTGSEADTKELFTAIKEKINQLLSGQSGGSPEINSLEAHFAQPFVLPSDNVVTEPAMSAVNLKAEAQTVKTESVTAVPPVIENIPIQNTAPVVEKAAPPAPAGASADGNLADSVVRVNVTLLDKIMNVVGELVLTRNQILQHATKMDSPEFLRLSSQLNAITTELQGDIMTTRMQPIGSILTRFERIVRDMARELGKKIALKIEGKDTELDKTLLEAIKDPLTHMVRNAVDHGMETIADRKAVGKSEEGVLLIKAYHEGGQVTIEIKDDGRGINKQRVLAKAIEKGVITQERARAMTEKEINNIIFMPGFSTAEKVTNISGRGVGMDVVKTNVEKIGGQVDVTSVEGAGSTFKLKIPLTLAIIPALIVQDEQDCFAIPQINLVELVRLDSEKLNLIEKINDAEFFRLRGNLIPLIRLGETLQIKPEQRAEKDSENIVVLNSEGRIFGLLVDSILDTQEIVVKPLGKQLKSIGLFAGATIMGDGHVALILDVQGLANKYYLSAEDEKSKVSSEAENKQNSDLQELMLFKLDADGLYAVPLSLVNRLEEFHKKDIEWVAKKAVIRYREQAMPLISLNSVLGYSEKELPDLISVFVVTLSGKFYGFVVNDILDICTTTFDVQSSSMDAEGMLGTIFVNEKTVSLVDIYWVAQKLGISAKAKAIAQKAAKKKRVLLAEDTPLYRKMVTQALTEAGYEVLAANDGQLAYTALLENLSTIDLIVSDIEMPNMNGLEFAKAVRANPQTKHLPMVALTSRFSPEDIQRGMAAGFNRYLEKFKKDDIIEAVGEVSV